MHIKTTLSNGDIYEGEGRDGSNRPILHGNGKMTYKNGNVYEGRWSEGTMVGTGTMTYANGDKYTIVKKATKRGQFDTGIMQYKNGDVLESNFADNLFLSPSEHPINKTNRLGQMTYANGDVYLGNGANYAKNGPGIINYANGDIFKGNFENNMRNGRGTLTFKNSVLLRISGIWKNDSPTDTADFLYNKKKINDQLNFKELLHNLKYVPKDIPNKTAPFIGSKYRKTKKSYIKRENIRKRCPNGTRKNPQTEVCEKKNM